MPRHILSLILLAFVASLIASAHIAAITHYWYWSYPLIDVPMHFSGGFFIGGFILVLLTTFDRSDRYLHRSIRNALLAALAVGFGWEVFETITGLSTGGPAWYYWYDSIKDLIMDMLGGVTAGFLFGKLLRASDYSKKMS